MNNRKKGELYEEASASFLIEKKYRILEKNYRRKTGEIDLIAMDPDRVTIVFVEVKYRTSGAKGAPEEAVGAEKQARIRRTAEWYLMEKRLYGSVRCRFDVISVTNGSIRHIINAFGSF